ncbi:unnamed protein product [Parnassius mnemosyne]|uniref:Uncharacterized protein n=1 Tax=Parnassius mnemosyne TaxID=213953 RepID=A0AAV1KYS3_9NEOP
MYMADVYDLCSFRKFVFEFWNNAEAKLVKWSLNVLCAVAKTHVSKQRKSTIRFTVQDDEESNILIKSNDENATSAPSKRSWETMLDVPSCSHESRPLRDATKENVNVPVCKK